MNLEGLTTEARNEATKKIDQVSTLEMVTLINQEDQKVAQAIEKVSFRRSLQHRCSGRTI